MIQKTTNFFINKFAFYQLMSSAPKRLVETFVPQIMTKQEILSLDAQSLPNDNNNNDNTLLCQYGCNKLCNLEDTMIHLVECPNVTIYCPNNGCYEDFRRYHLELHIKFYPYKLVKCNLGCDMTLHSKDLNFHQSDICTYRLTQCPDCGTMIRVNEIKEHRFECEAIEIRCHLCTEMINKKDKESHLIHTCPCRQVKCRLGCETYFEHDLLETHELHSCIFRVVKCSCGVKITNTDFYDHTFVCPNKITKCKKCSSNNHIKKCKHKKITCSKCSEKIGQNKIDYHLKKLCKTSE